MGFLEIGLPIFWDELTPEIKEKVRKDGLEQLVHIWSINEARVDNELYWGDEQEFTMVHLDHRSRKAQLVLEAPRLLQILRDKEEREDWDERLKCCKQLFLNKARKTFLRGAEWHPEFGNHMIEATPSPPYSLSVEGLLDVEESMTSRRLKLQEVLTQEFEDVYACSVTTMPNFGALDHAGAADYVYDCNEGERHDFFDNSVNIISKIPNPHPRFPTLVKNVNRRRGAKISCLIPVDDTEENIAKSAFWSQSMEEIPKDRSAIAAHQSVVPVKGFAYADSFAHGMSMNCLQVTFGAPNLRQSLFLYDQMVVLAPIFLSLSAATPALLGQLSALDTRWKVLEQTCDCRTEEELKEIPQSRYGCAPMFISQDSYLNEHESYLNDKLLPYDKSSYDYLIGAGFTERVARHFATLWLRDPLVIFSDKIDLDNKTRSDHFENIQSTNWNTVRFKPPPPSADGMTPHSIGWRVELRTPDLQLSDFQNAALSGIASLLALAILKHHWNFYMPISQIRENMELAHAKDSCISKKFWWNNGLNSPSAEKSLKQIFLDKEDGILSKLDAFVSEEWRTQRCSCEAVEQYRLFAALIRNRVQGRMPTNARELRDLIHRQRVVCQADDWDTVKVQAEPTTPQTIASPLKGSSASTHTTIDHDLNYEIIKYAVLAGYDHDIQLSHDVHSKSRSAPKCMHVCNQSPVLQSLSKLVSEELPQNLPGEIILAPSEDTESTTVQPLKPRTATELSCSGYGV